jgi:hypothetical protein
MPDARDRANIKISLGLHRRLKLFAVVLERPIEAIVEEAFDFGLTNKIMTSLDEATYARATAMLATLGQQRRPKPLKLKVPKPKPKPKPKRR